MLHKIINKNADGAGRRTHMLILHSHSHSILHHAPAWILSMEDTGILPNLPHPTMCKCVNIPDNPQYALFHDSFRFLPIHVCLCLSITLARSSTLTLLLTDSARTLALLIEAFSSEALPLRVRKVGLWIKEKGERRGERDKNRWKGKTRERREIRAEIQRAYTTFSWGIQEIIKTSGNIIQCIDRI